MTDASPLRSLRCPNCGAPLDFQPGQTTVRCRFCDSVFEHSAKALTAADHARVISADPPAQASAGTPAGPAKRYVIKLNNGQPVMLEAGGGAAHIHKGSSPSARGGATPARSGSSASAHSPSRLMPMSPARSGGSRLGCIVGVAIAVLVVIGVPALVLSTSPAGALMVGQLLAGHVQQALGNASTIGSNILLRSGTVVAGVNDSPAEALMLTTQYLVTRGSQEQRLVDVSTATRQLLWQTAPLSADLNSSPILASADAVIIVDGQKLLAFHRTDGTAAWQATLTDKLPSSCQGCLQLVGNQVAAFTADGNLQVLDAGTGKLQWQATAKAGSPRALYHLGQRVAFLDQDAQSNGIVRVFDLATGKATIVAPECQSSEPKPVRPDWTMALVVAPTGTDFYLDFGSFARCAQRYDAKTLKLVWSTTLPDTFAATLGLNPAFSADTVYMAYESNVAAYALAGGAARMVMANPDYQFQMLGTHGSDVLLQAIRQRGTKRYEIWAINGGAGQTHWKFDLGENPPLEAGAIIDDAQPMWTVQPSAAGLRVLRYQSAADNKSYALLADILNWDTGASGGQTRTPLHLDTIIMTAPDWLVWKNNTLWMEMNEQLLGFDAPQHKIVFNWP